MSGELHDIAAKLRHEWCDRFDAHVDAGDLIISTPIEFRDGDAFPVFVTRRGDRWRLSDRGATLSALPPASEFDLTDSRLQSIRDYLAAHRCTLTDGGEIVRVVRRTPAAAQIADFLRLTAAIYAAPELMGREAAEPFKRRMLTEVRSRLARSIAPLAVPRWPIPGDDDNRCDLWLPTEDTGQEAGVATFFVASPQPVLGAAVFTYALTNSVRSDSVVVGYDDERLSPESSEMRRLARAGDVEPVPIRRQDLAASRLPEVLAGKGVLLASPA